MKYSFFRFEGPSPALRAYMEVEDYHQLVLAMATQVSAMDLPMLRMSFLMEVHLLFQEYGVFYISLSTDSAGQLMADSMEWILLGVCE